LGKCYSYLLKTGFLFFFILQSLMAQQKITAYLFPGQGSDERIFSELKLDTNYVPVYVTYPIPPKGCCMRDYAADICKQIDSAGRYVFVGVSIGGMICTELAETCNPEKIIIVSSAKCRKELPWRYRFQKYIPLHKIVPRGLIKAGALMLQPVVEPDRNKRKDVFKSMLRNKDSKYLKRTINMIINWDRKSCSPAIVHIHGTKDHTLPFRRIKADRTLKKGSHMMMLTRSAEISALIREILRKKND